MYRKLTLILFLSTISLNTFSCEDKEKEVKALFEAQYKEGIFNKTVPCCIPDKQYTMFLESYMGLINQYYSKNQSDILKVIDSESLPYLLLAQHIPKPTELTLKKHIPKNMPEFLNEIKAYYDSLRESQLRDELFHLYSQFGGNDRFIDLKSSEDVQTFTHSDPKIYIIYHDRTTNQYILRISPDEHDSGHVELGIGLSVLYAGNILFQDGSNTIRYISTQSGTYMDTRSNDTKNIVKNFTFDESSDRYKNLMDITFTMDKKWLFEYLVKNLKFKFERPEDKWMSRRILVEEDDFYTITMEREEF